MDDLADIRADVIASLMPMSDFVDMGFLYTINRDYLIPRGYMIAIYLDDDDGKTALGWTCIDIETAIATGVYPTQEVIDSREEAFEVFEC